MSSYDQTFRNLHQTYCKLTGFNLPWTSERLFPWEVFQARFTQDDLRLVIRFIQERQRQHKPARSLNFRNFIAGPMSLENFAYDLSEARARARQPRPTARDRILEATGRSSEVTNEVRSAAQILSASESLKNLLQLRDSL